MYHYYMFNKPFGCVCARRDDRYPTVMDYFSDLDNPDLSPVGRLDRATEGLLLVTDDGMFNQKLTHPSYKKEKTYLFTAMGTLSEEDLYALEHGVQPVSYTHLDVYKRQPRIRYLKMHHFLILIPVFHREAARYFPVSVLLPESDIPSVPRLF